MKKKGKKEKEKEVNVDLSQYLVQSIDNNYSEIMIRSMIDHVAYVQLGLSSFESNRKQLF